MSAAPAPDQRAPQGHRRGGAMKRVPIAVVAVALAHRCVVIP